MAALMTLLIVLLVVAAAAVGFILFRRRPSGGSQDTPAGSDGYTRTGFSYGDPYPSDTYGTNPHGISLGSDEPDETGHREP